MLALRTTIYPRKEECRYGEKRISSSSITRCYMTTKFYISHIMQTYYRLDNGWSFSGITEIRYGEINLGRGLVKSNWTCRDFWREAFCSAVDLKRREKERKRAESEENMNVVARHAENFVPQFEERNLLRNLLCLAFILRLETECCRNFQPILSWETASVLTWLRLCQPDFVLWSYSVISEYKSTWWRILPWSWSDIR